MPKGATSRNTALAGGKTGDMTQTFRSSTPIPRQGPSQKPHHPIQVGSWSTKAFSGQQDFLKPAAKCPYLWFDHKPVERSRHWTYSAFTEVSCNLSSDFSDGRIKPQLPPKHTPMTTSSIKVIFSVCVLADPTVILLFYGVYFMQVFSDPSS